MFPGATGPCAASCCQPGPVANDPEGVGGAAAPAAASLGVGGGAAPVSASLGAGGAAATAAAALAASPAPGATSARGAPSLARGAPSLASPGLAAPSVVAAVTAVSAAAVAGSAGASPDLPYREGPHTENYEIPAEKCWDRDPPRQTGTIFSPHFLASFGGE